MYYTTWDLPIKLRNRVLDGRDCRVNLAQPFDKCMVTNLCSSRASWIEDRFCQVQKKKFGGAGGAEKHLGKPRRLNLV